MTVSLKSRILEDVKDAMRARDKARLGTLRMVAAAIKQREIDKRGKSGCASDESIALDDASVVAVLEKMLKQRRESAGQYESAGRGDLAAAERGEIAVIEQYMPRTLDPAEVDAMIAAAIEEAARRRDDEGHGPRDGPAQAPDTGPRGHGGGERGGQGQTVRLNPLRDPRPAAPGNTAISGPPARGPPGREAEGTRMAGRIPQSFIDDLVAETDIVEVVEHYVPLKRAGKEFTACCPFHDEKTPSFTVVPDKQFYTASAAARMGPRSGS